MIDGIAPLNHEIQDARAAYDATKQHLYSVIRTAQADCPHMQVLHAEYDLIGGSRTLYPLRMCVCCRLEEEATMGSTQEDWRVRGSANSARPVLGNEPHRLVIPVERVEIYRLRLPTPGGRWLANLAGDKEA